EDVHAAAGEERLVWARRVLAVERLLQQVVETDIGLLRQRLGGPRGQRVGLFVARQLQQRPFVERLELLVEQDDDLEVVRKRAQLRRAAQVELGAAVDVERALEVVGVDAQQVAARGAPD